MNDLIYLAVTLVSVVQGLLILGVGVLLRESNVRNSEKSDIPPESIEPSGVLPLALLEDEDAGIAGILLHEDINLDAANAGQAHQGEVCRADEENIVVLQSNSLPDGPLIHRLKLVSNDNVVDSDLLLRPGEAEDGEQPAGRQT